MTQPIIQVKTLVKEFTVGGGLVKKTYLEHSAWREFRYLCRKTLALVGESVAAKHLCSIDDQGLPCYRRGDSVQRQKRHLDAQQP